MIDGSSLSFTLIGDEIGFERYGRVRAMIRLRHCCFSDLNASLTDCFERALTASLWAGTAKFERSRESIAVLAGKTGSLTGCVHEK